MQPELSEIVHPKKNFKTVQVIWRFIYHFFSDIWYEPMVEWLRLVVNSLEILVRFQHAGAWCWILLLRCSHFAWHWARQCTDMHAFYIAALTIIFFLGFRQWQSFTDRVLTLNMNIWLPLFWSTWSWASCPDSATCAGLAHWRDHYSYVEPRS